MKYYIWTEGCQMNVADSGRVAAALEQFGYRPTTTAEDADVIVLNTCVVRQSAEDRAYGRLNSLRPVKQRRPNVVINLMGCLVGVKDNPRLRVAFPFVDVFSPPSDPRPLLEYLQQREARDGQEDERRQRHAILDGDTALPLQPSSGLISAYVPVVLGCSHGCSFCVIPYRRGPERSRPLEHVVREVETLALQGVREVTLLGQIVDRYGKDLPGKPTLSELLRRIHQIEDIQRIRFLTSHPNWLDAGILDAVAELPKICEHIEVPVQAGDDEVLRRMKRGYTADDFRRLVEDVRKRLPGASIATDVIVGFPGETEQQFLHTRDFLAELRLDVVHLARYSPRPMTVAARRMRDDVPDEEKLRRFRTLEALQAQIAADINQTYLARKVEILVTGKQKGRWKGRTRTNKLVFFDSEESLLGALVQVRIAWATPWSMGGELVLPVPRQAGRSSKPVAPPEHLPLPTRPPTLEDA